MNLSHLLVEAIRADREDEIATRLLASRLTSAETKSELRIARQAGMTTRQASMLRRLVLTI